MPETDSKSEDLVDREMHINGARKPRPTSMDEDSVDEMCMDDPGSPYNGTAASDRKRRRGVIEKRRRDRINSSLHDLKRLVPDNVHKPGTAKLEKAEILQATVDFIQRLYREGHVLSAEARAVELRRAGFKDCVLEVTRLLSSFDGQTTTTQHMEEMRRILLAHLHQCDQQRDQEAKAYLEHVAAVANAIGSSSSGSIRQTAPVTGQAVVTGTAKTAKRGTGTTGMDMIANCTKSSLPVTRNFSAANSYVPHLDQRLINSVHSTPTPYVYSTDRCTTKPIGGKASSITSYAYSPMKRLSDSGPACCHPTEAAYYPPDYVVNGKPGNSTESCAYLTPGASLENHRQYTQLSTQQQRIQQHEQQTVSSQHSQSFGANYSCTNPLGPNESQSTSSPPFHSTPDDADIGTSPNLLGGGKLTNSTESYSDPSAISVAQMKSDPTVDDSNPHGFPVTPNKSIPFYTHSTNSGLAAVSNLSELVSASDRSGRLSIKSEHQSHDNLVYTSYTNSFGSHSSSVGAYNSHPSNYDHTLTTSAKPTDWCPTAESIGTMHSQPLQAELVDYMPQWDYAFQTL
ncbi:Hairy/enhancer-of-split with YRPW motif protein 2 [Fasciola gigantica]|uniref:Hairy/enhancer-of-split with YRPW motif protein 2 n=1 Tax=Fasciola gigantica TaxID=46835 RepID=A0A504Z1P9_FASGI|nr:Hairy/enhancer-of-split with YRPW motif protein 2 [Fasciola gigantica]